MEKQVHISQYWGRIDVRLYDTKLRKNVAKIEIDHLLDFLNKKISKKQYKTISKGKGNALTVIELK